MEASRYPFAVMKNSHLFLSRDVKSLPTHEVRAIGWKLDGFPSCSFRHQPDDPSFPAAGYLPTLPAWITRRIGGCRVAL